MVKIAFIGTGNMASAIANGVIKSNILSCNQIMLFDKNTEQYKKFPKECNTANNINELCSFADYIFLSVKPQNINEVLNDIKRENVSEKVFVSICAGITVESIEKELNGAKIIRTMPNTPLLIGQGVTALCRNNAVTDEEFKFVTSLFASSGYTAELKESEINAITAVTSSSPAYVYYFIKSMLDGAKKLGLDGNNLLEMICRTRIGASNMVLSDSRSVDELIRMVKSPNGTTERALNVFESEGLSSIIEKAMIACAERADELSKLN